MTTENTIFAAVAKAMSEIKRVGKENRNAEQKYDFASIDDFMAMVGPICAANGLVTVIDECGREFLEKPGKYGPTQWVGVSYQITTFHASGNSLPPVHRHIEVIRNGPQAYGAAQSYILKQYYRGLFAIPTGDKDDPDFGNVAEEKSAPKQQDRKQQERKQDAPDAEAIAKACDYLSEADSLDDLKERWGRMPKQMQSAQAVIEAKDKAKEALSNKRASDDLDGDEIPY